MSTEYRADNVVVLHDRGGNPVTGVIVEVQLQDDHDKLLAWPVYVAALRAKLRCPAVLLVITREPAVARWARRPIELGQPVDGDAACFELLRELRYSEQNLGMRGDPSRCSTERTSLLTAVQIVRVAGPDPAGCYPLVPECCREAVISDLYAL